MTSSSTRFVASPIWVSPKGRCTTRPWRRSYRRSSGSPPRCCWSCGGSMRTRLQDDLRTRAAGLKEEGLFKTERVIGSPQSAHIRLADGTSVLNLCANNYLGLADHPDIVNAAHRALDESGYGMASVR